MRLALVVLFAALPALAAPAPIILSHEGRLLDANDHPVSGPVKMKFGIYKNQQPPNLGADDAWWEATEITVVVAMDGHYAVPLGHPNIGTGTIPKGTFDGDGERWLGIAIAGQMMLPRILVTSVPWALSAVHADAADALGGHAAADYALKTDLDAATAAAIAGARTYVDTSATATLATAKTAVDTGNAATLAGAKAYADTGDTASLAGAKTYADTGDATSLVTAKAYADGTLTTSKAYADGQSSGTLTSAKTYTDSGDTATLAAGKTYADTKDATNLTAAKAYADAQIAANASTSASTSPHSAKGDLVYNEVVTQVMGATAASYTGHIVATAGGKSYYGRAATTVICQTQFGAGARMCDVTDLMRLMQANAIKPVSPDVAADVPATASSLPTVHTWINTGTHRVYWGTGSSNMYGDCFNWSGLSVAGGSYGADIYIAPSWNWPYGYTEPANCSTSYPLMCCK